MLGRLSLNPSRARERVREDTFTDSQLSNQDGLITFVAPNKVSHMFIALICIRMSAAQFSEPSFLGSRCAG